MARPLKNVCISGPLILIAQILLSFVLYTSAASSRDMLAKVGMTYNKPEQIHICFGATSTDVVIMWSSSAKEKSHVEFGNSHDSLKRVESTIAELERDSKNAAKYIHRVELKGLVAASRYTYRIVNGVSEIKSDSYRFDVPDNNPKKSHTFMVVADMGLVTKSLHFVVHEALNNKYEMVFHIGDIAYDLNGNGGKYGDMYMNKIEKMAAQVPYMTTPGDHERYDDFYHYRYRFSTPNAGWPMKMEELWYSFDIGLAHFISINTHYFTSLSPLEAKHLDWLKKDLKSANENRQAHPWIIVMGHKPVYCTKSVMAQECDQEKSELRADIDDLLFEYGVDLYLSGHKHCYERSWPMYRGHPFQMDYKDPTATVHIIIGAMGYEYLTDKQNSKASWLAFAMSNREKELFANLTVLNSTHLLWSALNADNNEIVDSIQIVQHQHSSFGPPGEEALKRIQPGHQVSEILPPIPYIIIDERPTSFFIQNRYYMLFFTVFCLSLTLFFFLRSARVRKVLRF